MSSYLDPSRFLPCSIPEQNPVAREQHLKQVQGAVPENNPSRTKRENRKDMKRWMLAPGLLLLDPKVTAGQTAPSFRWLCWRTFLRGRKRSAAFHDIRRWAWRLTIRGPLLEIWLEMLYKPTDGWEFSHPMVSSSVIWIQVFVGRWRVSLMWVPIVGLRCRRYPFANSLNAQMKITKGIRGCR